MVMSWLVPWVHNAHSKEHRAEPKLSVDFHVSERLCPLLLVHRFCDALPC
jgi:hypothetical protein